MFIDVYFVYAPGEGQVGLSSLLVCAISWHDMP